MDRDAFFVVHRDLDREGPGLAEDVVWAAHVAGLRRDGRVCDAGCGPGGDLAELRRAVPEGRVDGFDQVPHFVQAAKDRFADDPAVTVTRASMAGLGGPYDLIWSAGAVYFLGVEQALTLWRKALSQTGAVVFSHPALWSDNASEAARNFWGGDAHGTDAENRAEIAAAGYGVIDARRVSEAGWEAYYGPLLARCDQLEADGASAAVAEAIAQMRDEAAAWRAIRMETGYMLYAVRPL